MESYSYSKKYPRYANFNNGARGRNYSYSSFSDYVIYPKRQKVLRARILNFYRSCKRNPRSYIKITWSLIYRKAECIKAEEAFCREYFSWLAQRFGRV